MNVLARNLTRWSAALVAALSLRWPEFIIPTLIVVLTVLAQIWIVSRSIVDPVNELNLQARNLADRMERLQKRGAVKLDTYSRAHLIQSSAQIKKVLEARLAVSSP